MSVSGAVASVSDRLKRFEALSSRLAGLAALDAAQAVLWSPVLFAAGIGTYFSMPVEPALLPVAVFTALAVLASVLLRRSPALGITCTVVALFAAGFFSATLRTEMLATEILSTETGPVELSAVVADLERRPDGTVRLTLMDVSSNDTGIDLPGRLRITVRTDVGDVAVGDTISTRAVLMPPGGPTLPGGFDFGRQAWFNGLGAVGYSVSAIKRVAAAPSSTDPLDTFVTGLRISISDRIRGQLDDPAAGIAIALMTGRRAAISKETYSVFRDSGIAHILALSGLHMGLVAGLLFFTIRALLALWERGALYYPIKKWAAAGTLFGCFLYLFVGGMSVSIQRAFIMTGLVLIAIMVDRTAISMHRVAWAAMVVLLVTPESLMAAGFQMSFAAVVALIAFYERFGGMLLARARSKPLLKRAGFYLIGILATTLISDMATAPFAAYHFNRIAGLGLITNLFAVPLVGAWIMPFALAAYFLMPFGLEGLALIPMGWGIDLLFAGASYIAARPDSVFLVPAIPTAAFLLFVFGGLWLCLWRQKWRRLGLVPMAVALVLAVTAVRPHILVAAEGNLAAVRLNDGNLAVSSQKSARYVREKWLQRDGMVKAEGWSEPGSLAKGGPNCDEISCSFRAEGIHTVFANDARALAEDCLRADLLIARFPVPEACASPAAVIDLWDLRAGGTHAIYLDDGIINIVRTRSTRGDRPWTRAE